MKMAKEKRKRWVFFWYGSKDRRLEARKAHAVAVGTVPQGHLPPELREKGHTATRTSRRYGVGFKGSGVSNFMVSGRMLLGPKL